MDAMGEEAMVGARRGTRPAPSPFDLVYDAERRAVVRLAALLVGSQAVAEELAQDAFMRLLERFDHVDNPPGFLRTVVVRLSVSWQRRHRTEERVIQTIGVDRATGTPEIDETWDALCRLDPDRRAVLVLRYYEHMRHREIADVLGCPAATVRSRTRRALKDLRQELTR